ncbi:epoxide hydrolase [Streptomyces sp. NPDC007100]|uniref:epoxide hydrolase family protein n=1 Tax=Streptomyces sp. NPDC007100 TaxID=3155602 RepID=UPI0033E7624D
MSENTATRPEKTRIEPYPVRIPDRELTLLRARLDEVRLPEPETVPDATQGIGLDRLRELLTTWRQHDWRATEARWNAIPHYRARLDGLDIAFWHVRSPEPTALPLVLTHGWPGSVLEFENVLGPLTDPVAHGGSATDAFHVVVPALPGFGFSERPRERGWQPARTARAWAGLLTALGYERFGAHGGDWGAYVSTELARQVPERVAGLHLTMPLASPLPEDRNTRDPAEQRMLERRDAHLADGYGFGMIMATRPQTLGYSLLDSPRRPGGLARREVRRLRRHPAGGRRRSEHDAASGEHRPVLADRDRRLQRPLVLGGHAVGAPQRRRGERATGDDAHRLHAVPRRTVADRPALGRAPLPGPPLVARDGPRRPLPRPGTAGPAGRRDPGRVPTRA